MCEKENPQFKQLKKEIFKYVGNEKSKIITQADLLPLIISMTTGRPFSSSGSSKIFNNKSGKGFYFDYICQILRIFNKIFKLNKALYTDGEIVKFIDRKKDMKYLERDSAILKEITDCLKKHIHGETKYLKKKKAINKDS